MILALAACSEFALQQEPDAPPAEPIPRDPDAAYGQPPDWTTCSAGWLGQYYNLESEDAPEVTPDRPDTQDWWDDDRRVFQRFDGSLDPGANWWPVDEGIEGDPAFFAARWTAWMRVTGGGSIDVVLGAQTVAWLSIDEEVVLRGEEEAALVEVPIDSGQHRIEVRFAQLGPTESTLRFRIAEGEAQVCFPDFSSP